MPPVRFGWLMAGDHVALAASAGSRAVLSAVVICIMVAGLPAFAGQQSAGPPVVGDEGLFAVVRAAQRANLERFRSGELVVQRREYRNHEIATPVIIMDNRFIWDGDKSYCELVFSTPAAGAEPPADPVERRQWEVRVAAEYVSDIRCRMVFDGRRFILYSPDRTTPYGKVDIFPPARLDDHFAFQEEQIDQRPMRSWRIPDGSAGRLWEEMIGPHADFPQEMVAKWEVQRDENLVRIVRHHTEGHVSRMEADLSRGGHVVSTAFQYGSGPMKGRGSSSEYEWVPYGDDGYVLQHFVRRVLFASGTERRQEMDVRVVRLNEPIDPKTFTFEALKVKPGALVVDGSNRYTHRADAVDQGALDDLVEQNRAGDR